MTKPYPPIHLFYEADRALSNPSLHRSNVRASLRTYNVPPPSHALELRAPTSSRLDSSPISPIDPPFVAWNPWILEFLVLGKGEWNRLLFSTSSLVRQTGRRVTRSGRNVERVWKLEGIDAGQRSARKRRFFKVLRHHLPDQTGRWFYFAIRRGKRGFN